MRYSIVIMTVLLCLPATRAHAQCIDADGDGYGVYPQTSKLAGCAHDGIDCDDGDAKVHPFAKEICGNGKDDNCRHGQDEGCGAAAPFDGWRVMPIRSQGEFDRKEPGGRAEQWLQGAARCVANPDVIYLSHDCSVIWRSVDGGKSWEKPLSLGFYLAHGQSIEVDPVDCQRVVAIADNAWDYKNTAFAGIYLSEDGGEHWTLVQPGPTMNSRRYEHNIASAPASVDAQGAKSWYAALYNEPGEAGHAQSALYRSDDRGATWRPLASLAAHYPVYELRVSPSDTDHLLLATGSGLLESKDGGKTLTQLSAGLPAGEVTSVAFDPQHAARIHVVVRGASGGLFRSSDGGKSFSALSAADSLHQAVLADARRVVVHPAQGDVFYVVPQSSSGGRTAIRTADGGASFSTTTISLAPDVKSWRWGVNISGAFAFILPSATDAKQAVAQGGGAALFRSQDGVAFENGSTLYTGANCAGNNYSVAFDPQDPQRMVVAHQDIGSFLTENGGDWFVARGVPHAWVGQGKISWSSQWVADINPTAKDQLLSVVGSSFKRKLVRSSDAGASWTIADPSQGHFFRVVYHPQDPMIVLAGDLRSQDGGASFAPLNIPAAINDADVQVIDLCRAQPDVVYAASRSSRRIIRSDDKGKTWRLYVQAQGSIAPFDPYITMAVDPVNCDALYTLDAAGDLARYDGKSWQSLGVLKQLGAPQGYYHFVRGVQVDPNHPELIYVSIFGAGIPSLLRSEDGGTSWTDISYNRFRAGGSGINISPHSGEVLVGSCSGTWVLPPPYATNHGIYHKLVSRPSCFDGLENGDEGGVDCGGRCAALCASADGGGGAPRDAGPASGDGPQRGDGKMDSGSQAGGGDDGCGCGVDAATSPRGPLVAILLILVCFCARRRWSRGASAAAGRRRPCAARRGPC
jgi:photosystem II stability/assembly factor-like uncharacterized protein